SASRVVGYLFFLLCLIRPRLTFRRPPLALWCFGVYFAFFVVEGFFQPSLYSREIFTMAFRLVQFMALMWLSYNLFQVERAARWWLWGFGLACVAVGILLTAGIGVSTVKTYHGTAARQSVFSTSPNTIACMIGLGAVALIGLAYGREGAGSRAKYVASG